MKHVQQVHWFAFVLLVIIGIAGCGGGGSNPTTPDNEFAGYNEYLEVKIVSNTGIEGIGENPEMWDSSRDTDPAVDRLFIPEPKPGNYFIWFRSTNGGQVSFTINTNSDSRTYSNCRIPAGALMFDAIASVRYPGGVISDNLLEPQCQ